MKDGTRLIFWLDLIILLVVSGLAVAGQWDFVLALVVGLAVMNYFDRWWQRHDPDS